MRQLLTLLFPGKKLHNSLCKFGQRPTYAFKTKHNQHLAYLHLFILTSIIVPVHDAAKYRTMSFSGSTKFNEHGFAIKPQIFRTSLHINDEGFIRTRYAYNY